jgi:hypothetical protein
MWLEAVIVELLCRPDTRRLPKIAHQNFFSNKHFFALQLQGMSSTSYQKTLGFQCQYFLVENLHHQ